MKYALLADIHSNIEALDACLEKVEQFNPDQYIFLGDLVGYGADPVAVLNRIRSISNRVVIKGNHDAAVAIAANPNMREDVRQAIDWTRMQLQQSDLDWLNQLPLTFREGHCLFVHANAISPEKWSYVLTEAEAMHNMNAVQESVIFCGHVHEPKLYSMGSNGRAQLFIPTSGVSIPLIQSRKWFSIVGSVGQPRDKSTLASCAVYDSDKNQLTYFRVIYDYLSAADKIRKAGLPTFFADRLERGE